MSDNKRSEYIDDTFRREYFDRFDRAETPYRPEPRWSILEKRRQSEERKAVQDWAKRHGLEDQSYNVQYARYLLREDGRE